MTGDSCDLVLPTAFGDLGGAPGEFRGFGRGSWLHRDASLSVTDTKQHPEKQPGLTQANPMLEREKEGWENRGTEEVSQGRGPLI